MHKYFLAFLISFSAYSAPKHLEIWFLSAAKATEVMKLFKPNYLLGPMKAERLCQQVGEYCFDPQIGLYKKSGTDFNMVNDAPAEKIPQIPSASSVDRDLISCDPTNRFDMFCGKAQKLQARQKTKLEVWVDTSSSMKEMDFSDSNDSCYRKSFMSKLDQVCPFNQKMSVSVFDTSIKEAGTIDGMCINQGLNDEKRMLDWIERSTAETLIIITDVYELHKDVADYVESIHGKVRGDKENMTAKDLLKYVDDVAKFCR
jgi:hypothetical protein